MGVNASIQGQQNANNIRVTKTKSWDCSSETGDCEKGTSQMNISHRPAPSSIGPMSSLAAGTIVRPSPPQRRLSLLRETSPISIDDTNSLISDDEGGVFSSPSISAYGTPASRRSPVATSAYGVSPVSSSAYGTPASRRSPVSSSAYATPASRRSPVSSSAYATPASRRSPVSSSAYATPASGRTPRSTSRASRLASLRNASPVSSPSVSRSPRSFASTYSSRGTMPSTSSRYSPSSLSQQIESSQASTFGNSPSSPSRRPLSPRLSAAASDAERMQSFASPEVQSRTGSRASSYNSPSSTMRSFTSPQSRASTFFEESRANVSGPRYTEMSTMDAERDLIAEEEAVMDSMEGLPTFNSSVYSSPSGSRRLSAASLSSV